MKENEFKCGFCGRTFEKGWSEEESWAEARERYGRDIRGEDTTTLCDDCDKYMMEINPPKRRQ